MFGGIGVGVAALYYVFNMRATLQTRQAQLFMQSFNLWLWQGYADKLVELLLTQQWSDFDDWREKYGGLKNPAGASAYFTLDTYFEGIGTLVKRKLIDPHLVDDLMGSDIIMYWKKMRPVAEGLRKQEGLATWAENSEYLYDEMRKIYREQQPDVKI